MSNALQLPDLQKYLHRLAPTSNALAEIEHHINVVTVCCKCKMHMASYNAFCQEHVMLMPRILSHQLSAGFLLAGQVTQMFNHVLEIVVPTLAAHLQMLLRPGCLISTDVQ